MSDLMFNNTSQNATLTITILEDNLLEVNETFKVDIGVIGKDSSNCLLVQPCSVDISILDNDGNSYSIIHQLNS